MPAFITVLALQTPPVAMPVPVPPPPPVFAPAPPPAPPGVGPARPRLLNAWGVIGSDDYPKKLRKAGVQGGLRYRVSVSAEGRVTDCAVVVSSRVAEFDALTCKLLRSRARFSPARDAAGRAIAQPYEGNIYWRLPNGPPVPLRLDGSP